MFAGYSKEQVKKVNLHFICSEHMRTYNILSDKRYSSLIGLITLAASDKVVGRQLLNAFDQVVGKQKATARSF